MGIFSNLFGPKREEPTDGSQIPNSRVAVALTVNEAEKSDWAASPADEDRVEKAIRASGCWDNHLSVVECMGERRDWRLCQESLEGFKNCMTKASIERATGQRPKYE